MGLKAESKYQLMTGYEACVEGMLTAGCRFYAAYPITPASEILELMTRRMPRVGGVFVQMEDELASIGAVIGASWTGVKAATATSGPGFSLMQEGLGFAVATETPCVIVDVQRVGPSGGGIFNQQGDVMQAKWGTHGHYHEIIALSPSSVQETFDVMIQAFNLSEEYRVPVIVLADERIIHLGETMKPPKDMRIVNRAKPTAPPEEFVPYEAPADSVPPMPSFGDGYAIHYTAMLKNVMGYERLSLQAYPQAAPARERLITKITRNIDKISMVEDKFLEDADIAVFAYGSEARSAAHAVAEARKFGLRVGYIRPTTVWPFHREKVAKLCEGVKKILVCEANAGQLVGEVERAVGCRGKVEFLGRFGDMHSPKEILDKVKELME